jgi:hypothetical protein
MLSGRQVTRIVAVAAAVAVCLAGTWTAIGVTISGCVCIPMYGEPTNSCSAKSGKHVSASEEKATRNAWIAGANEESERCGKRMKALVAGTVFVADGDLAPRAAELLKHECGPFTRNEEEYFRNPKVPPPLRKTNPALCDRLAAGAPPEAFALRQEGKTLYFYYFAYDEVAGGLRMRELYSKIAMDPASLWFGTPPMLNALCSLQRVPGSDDEGTAPLSHYCWGNVMLTSEDPALATPRLCYGHEHKFRRTDLKLEVGDGG